MASRFMCSSSRSASFLRTSVFKRAFSYANSSGVVKKLYRREDIHGDTKLSGLLVEGMNEKVKKLDEIDPDQIKGKKVLIKGFTRTVEDGRLIGGCNLFAVDEGASSVDPKKEEFLVTTAFERRTATGTWTPLDNCVVHLGDDYEVDSREIEIPLSILEQL